MVSCCSWSLNAGSIKLIQLFIRLQFFYFSKLKAVADDKINVIQHEVPVSFQARPIFFLRIDDSHSYRIHSSLTDVRCFDNGCGEAASGLERTLCRVLVKELLESMDRCSGLRDITEILLKTALNTIQLINQTSIQ